MIKVAVDAMGGDYAPGEMVAGAVEMNANLAFRCFLWGRSRQLFQNCQSPRQGPDSGCERHRSHCH